MVGIVLSGLTFAGVFTLLLSPFISGWGLSYLSVLLLLLGGVAVVFLSLGFVLDRVVKFWGATALVGTTRNQFLVSRLYSKEWLSMVNHNLPVLRAVRMLVAESTGGGSLNARQKLLEELDKSVARLEETAKERRWVLREGEDIYEDAK
jgi:hypothetical protein